MGTRLEWLGAACHWLQHHLLLGSLHSILKITRGASHCWALVRTQLENCICYGCHTLKGQTGACPKEVKQESLEKLKDLCVLSLEKKRLSRDVVALFKTWKAIMQNFSAVEHFLATQLFQAQIFYATALRSPRNNGRVRNKWGWGCHIFVIFPWCFASPSPTLTPPLKHLCSVRKCREKFAYIFGKRVDDWTQQKHLLLSICVNKQ